MRGAAELLLVELVGLGVLGVELELEVLEVELGLRLGLELGLELLPGVA